jgi:DNA replication protein DnaC
MARNTRRPPATDPLQELIQLAGDLDLTALAQVLPEILSRAEKEALSFTEFASALLRTEVTARRDRSLARGLRRSRLGTVEGLDGFDFAKRPQLEPRVVRELLNCRFVEERRNVLCLGKPGLGKTRVAKAIAHAACSAGYSTLCVLTAEMLEDLHASQPIIPFTGPCDATSNRNSFCSMNSRTSPST